MSTRLQMSGRCRAQEQPSAPARHGLLQRKCACNGYAGVDGVCDKCRGNRLSAHHDASAQSERFEAPPIVHEVLNTPGEPLDQKARAFMEPRFGHDFGQVRIHADARAAESARAVNALAYTVGRSIVFAAAQYDPSTPAGQRLLAHELTHTIQQGRASAGERAGLEVSSPDDSMERAAHQIAESVMSDGSAPSALMNYSAPLVRSGPARLHRQVPPAAPPAVIPAPRVVYLDTNVIDQITRGNKDVVAALRKMQANGDTIRIARPNYTELMRMNPQLNETRRLIIREFGIEVEPVSSVTNRAKEIELYATKGIKIQEKDLPMVAAAKQGKGQLWSMDGGVQQNAKLFGVQMAAESTTVQKVQGKHDYRVGLDLVGLKDVDVAPDGLVTRRPLPPAGGTGGPGSGGGSPPPAGGTPPPSAAPPAGAAGKGAGAAGKGAGAAVEAVEVTEPHTTPQRARPAPSRRAPVGVHPTAGGVALRMGIGFASAVTLGIATHLFRGKVIDDLAKLPKPKVDVRSGRDYFTDPNVSGSARVVDLLHKNLPAFARDLQDHHTKAISAAQIEALAIGVSSLEAQNKLERLDGIESELADYEDQLYTIRDNLDALIELEAASLEVADGADMLRDLFSRMIAMDILLKAGIPYDQIIALPGRFQAFSGAIRASFRNARAAKAVVERLIGEAAMLRVSVNKIWWAEFKIEFDRLQREALEKAEREKAAKERAAASAPAVAPPKPKPAASAPKKVGKPSAKKEESYDVPVSETGPPPLYIWPPERPLTEYEKMVGEERYLLKKIEENEEKARGRLTQEEQERLNREHTELIERLSKFRRGELR